MIDKKKAIETIYAKTKEFEEKPDIVLGLGIAMSAVMLMEETETKRAKWISEMMHDGDMAFRCSNCRELFADMQLYPYCPRCGAEMEV